MWSLPLIVFRFSVIDGCWLITESTKREIGISMVSFQAYMQETEPSSILCGIQCYFSFQCRSPCPPWVDPAQRTRDVGLQTACAYQGNVVVRHRTVMWRALTPVVSRMRLSSVHFLIILAQVLETNKGSCDICNVSPHWPTHGQGMDRDRIVLVCHRSCYFII